jgi:hypothetical protein
VPELLVPIRRRGALLNVLLRACSQEQQVAHDGISLTQSGRLLAYLDTGASDTVLDLQIIRRLGLRADRSVALHVLGRDGTSFHHTYSVEVSVAHATVPPHWLPLTVLGGAVYQTGAVMALGRDFLSQFVFTYDGPNRRVGLRW